MDVPLQKAIKSIVATAQPDKIILFGSRAQGKGTDDSDYDLLVVKHGVSKKRALTQQIYRNFKAIGAPVDIVVANTEDVDQNDARPYHVYHTAITNGKIVYEK